MDRVNNHFLKNIRKKNLFQAFAQMKAEEVLCRKLKVTENQTPKSEVTLVKEEAHLLQAPKSADSPRLRHLETHLTFKLDSKETKMKTINSS